MPPSHQQPPQARAQEEEQQQREQPRAPRAAAAPAGRPLVRVPLDLVLSAALPGCSPAAARAPELAPLLAERGAAWELQLAGLLLWSACGGGGGGGGGDADCRGPRFWRRYARALPPAAEQASLLLFREEELGELQDPELAREARAWRREVKDAHRTLFGGGAASSSDGSSGGGGGRGGAAGGGWPPSLEDWLWAVASNESRAFGVMVGGLEIQAAVPFLDLANHSPGAPPTHGIAGGSGSGSSSSGGGADGPAGAGGFFELMSSVDYAAGQEVFIDYGRKGSRTLMEQYGFVVPGNPFDRLPLDGLQLPGGCRMSRDAITAAAAALEAAAPAGGAAAGAARTRAAAASLTTALGWRDLREWRRVDAGSTATCVAAAREHLARRLAAWPTTPEEDARLLGALCATGVEDAADGRGVGGGGPGAVRRRAAAVRYRLERKLLIVAGLELLQRLER
ncbi:MAG: hypothetical protein J3K34DRAFT_504586 [Monoraphidium minutum]|nr:MAG: hypothetical protein J3K34DRAFT_504586 [Monoraphidium minutum]